jgi:hypothetical protein
MLQYIPFWFNVLELFKVTFCPPHAGDPNEAWYLRRLVMSDNDLKVALGQGDGVRFSNNVALFLSKKVTEAQREIVHQLQIEAVDHTRSETAEKEPDKGRVQETSNDKEGLGVQPEGDTKEAFSNQNQSLNIVI